MRVQRANDGVPPFVSAVRRWVIRIIQVFAPCEPILQFNFCNAHVSSPCF
jgi:hypothetical protein